MDVSILDYVIAQLQLTKGSWSEVAEESGVPKRTIEKIARREIKNPGVITIEALAKHFRERPEA